jgi:hypothetical protein
VNAGKRPHGRERLMHQYVCEGKVFMRHRLVRIFMPIMVVLASSTAAAQEAGKVGLTMGFPAAVGVIWHATPRVALRPEFTFTHSSSEGLSVDSSTTAVGLGIGALFYVKKWDSVATYWTPRFAWGHATHEASSTFVVASEVTSNTYQYSGSFGAQGWIGQRFSAFGEVGLAYQRGTSKSANTGLRTTSDTLTTRAGVGVALYF